jgi:hypothetical protein
LIEIQLSQEIRYAIHSLIGLGGELRRLFFDIGQAKGLCQMGSKPDPQHRQQCNELGKMALAVFEHSI